MTSVLAEGFTVADLDALPDDGFRRELMDGLLVVSPPPVLGHQLASGNLHAILHAAKQPGQSVLAAPFGLRISDKTQFEPDLAVVDRAAVTGAVLTTPPVLVVEILSPSTASYDRRDKADAYAGFGVQRFWLVDPRKATLSITELRLDRSDPRNPTYVSVQVAAERFHTESPFRVAFDVADLLA